ncbi:MAG: hypothetical protein IKT98_07980 [Selenomonadaceae bacterium]|nr:hypothetical protein [Selenomonadaceae bacterium]
MENALPKNRPTRRDFVNVNRSQFDHIFSEAAVAKGDEIARNLAKLKDDIASACDKTFVMMKNKQVWFDRNNAALFPKFHKFSLPRYKTRYAPSLGYSTNFEGFNFVAMTINECQKSFTNNKGNPYLKSDGNFNHFPIRPDRILTDDGHRFVDTNGGVVSWDDSYEITLVPIHRLRGKNAAAMNYPEALLAWIANGLIPEGLSTKQETFYKTFLNDYPKIEDYISADSTNIKFDGERFKADVLSGKFTAKVFDYDFDIRGTLDGVISGQRQYSGSVDSLKKELLACDNKRANIQPYEERLLTDVNRGHWELFEDAAADTAKVNLPADSFLVARPPQLDVRYNGICAIDFGTKSTIVVCRDGDARMLRIGQGDYSKAPTMRDFENPTVIELRDIQNFLTAYRVRGGRPFTEWNQVTVSHQAADAIFKEGVGSTVYNSVFNELKQWAKDEQNYPVLKDLRGATLDIKPYLETKEIDAGDFDPIELYAYYLGLYINNMHNQIYPDYILSFPVNYKKAICERIRKSFESGIKKSLPPALLRDEEFMKRFRVYLGASEPAAYAISALECFGLEPKEVGEKVAYGVFDFGGGTTDFDFGIEYIPENRRKCNFIIEQFGFNGDVLLGGENMLELLAYEVYKDNLDKMREKKIPFALPAGCKKFAGAEALVKENNKDASAHMNNRILAEKLRPIWENTAEREKLTEDAQSWILFSSEKQSDESYKVNVDLKIEAAKLEQIIEARIREGVVNFFQSLWSAFDGRFVCPIHIFLAGNSCRSPIVKKLFEEFIKREEDKLAESVKKNTGQDKDATGTFILHMPLGMEEGDESANVMELDKQRTGKTGVAFGLLRCRRGGKDVKINNENETKIDINFPYFLGDAGNDGNTFTVRIGQKVSYGEWVYFTVADEPEFELYYTKAPRSLQNNMPVSDSQIQMIHCLLDEDDTIDDDNYGVYIKKVSPNMIEYAVGRAEDFAGELKVKRVYQQILKDVR